MTHGQHETASVIFQAHLRGSEPMVSGTDGEPAWPSEWVDRLAAALDEDDEGTARSLCRAKATAELLCAEATVLLGDGDSLPAEDIDLSGIRVDRTETGSVVRIHRWAAAFRVTVSRSVIESWCAIDAASGRSVFELAQYEAWLDDNGIWGLQDAVRFHLWGVAYELDGMGEQSCLPDPASVAAALG